MGRKVFEQRKQSVWRLEARDCMAITKSGKKYGVAGAKSGRVELSGEKGGWAMG